MDVTHVIVGLLLFAVLTDVVASTLLPLSISPAHVHLHLLPHTRANVNVTCTAPANITQCQFKVGLAPIIDPRLGTNGDQAVGYSSEWDEGRCRVTLPWRTFGLDGTYIEVGCRVRDDVTDWSYATMSVYGSKRRGLASNASSSVVTAARGEAVSLLATASTPLTTCRVLLADHVWNPLNKDKCDGRVCYHGDGLERGQCGVTLNNVTEEDNGKLWLRLEDADVNEGVALVHVIVQKPPTSLTLESKVTSDKGGALTLKAWCSVIGGRPPPNITWFVADSRVTEGVISVPHDEWAWPEDERTINQSLTRKLREADLDKELRCTATFFDRAQMQTISDTSVIVYGRTTPRPTPTVPSSDVVNVTYSPANLRHHEENAVLSYGVAACALFGVAILLYVTVLSLNDFTLYAWRKQLYCFKHFSYESSTFLDDDVMDYHATMPTGVTVGEDVRLESYLEPISVPQNRDSYFMSTLTESSRTSTMKAERTLGLAPSRRPLPTPRHVQASHKKQKTRRGGSKTDSLFMPTPVDQLDQLGAAGSYKTTDDDTVPLYANINIFPAASNQDGEQAYYGNLEAINTGGTKNAHPPAIDDSCAFYGNIEAIHTDTVDTNAIAAVHGNFEAVDAGDPTYGNIYPQRFDSDLMYENF